MNKFLQNTLSLKIEDKFADINDKIVNFINKHPEIFSLGLLAVFCFIFLFFGIGLYPLIDVDETRYAVMARDLLHSNDWNSLMLNGVPFLEKPPLYFWLVGASIKFFGGFTPFAVRFPIALLAAFLVFFTYYVGKKIISRKYGIISALVLLTSAFFLILSHIAILDMVLTVFMTSAIYCSLLTHFCQEKNKKYLWFLFYLFIALGFLSKGILAFVIPVAVIFTYNLITGTLKDIFKPVNLLPGFIAFLITITPWHYVMYQEYGYKFVKEYFLLHHFARFINSETIGRERPLLYFVPVFLFGFMPWSFAFLDFVFKGFKKVYAKGKETQGKLKDKIFALFETNTNEQKLILFSVIYFVIVFALFSSSSTKLPTYILPAFPAASLLMGYYWWVSDERHENEKSTYDLTLLFSGIFIFAAIGASAAYYALPYELQYKLSTFREIAIIAIYLLAILLILRLNTKRALSVFWGYLVVMFFVITLAVGQIFNLVYTTGENEIVKYSIISANNLKPSQLVTFDFAVKPSVMIHYTNKVNFITEPDFDELDKLLEYKNGPTFVIIKNKNLIGDDKYCKKLAKRLKVVKTGERYSLYVNDIQSYKSLY